LHYFDTKPEPSRSLQAGLCNQGSVSLSFSPSFPPTVFIISDERTTTEAPCSGHPNAMKKKFRICPVQTTLVWLLLWFNCVLANPVTSVYHVQNPTIAAAQPTQPPNDAHSLAFAHERRALDGIFNSLQGTRTSWSLHNAPA